jgi:hypothetical protein
MEKEAPESTTINALLSVSLFLTATMAVCNSEPASDLYLALAAGRNYLQAGLGGMDPWSFTAQGKLWVDQGWLSNVMYFLSLEALGMWGPLLAKIILLAGCIAVSWSRCRNLGVSTPISLFTLAFATLAAAPFLGIRAQNFGVFYFVLFFGVLALADRNTVLRRLAVPMVLLIWSNSHGSFMLGLGILTAKTLLVLLRAVSGRSMFGSVKGSWREAGEWMIVFGVSVILVSFLSPFGTNNILMPFVQVGTSVVTAHSSDWLPLFDRDFMFPLTGRGSVYFFLLFVGVVLVSILIEYFGREKKPLGADADSRDAGVPETQVQGLERKNAESPNRAEGFGQWSPNRTYAIDWAMEAVVVLVTLALAVKFRRLIPFSAYALVPTGAMVFGILKERIVSSAMRWEPEQRRSPLLARIPIIAAAVVCLGTAWLCYRVAIVPHSPANPFRPERSLVNDLVSNDTFSKPLVRFLIENRIDGNILAGWSISSYLLYAQPNIKIFMDTRDQSYYPKKVISDYFSIVGVTPDSVANRISLIDEYQVSTIVMTTSPYDFNLVQVLMKSGKWGCIYKDDYSVVLVRADSPRFRSMLTKADFAALRYPNQETRIRSEAFQSFLALGYVRPELVAQLKRMVSERPWPNQYGYIVMGMETSPGCFTAGTVKYLASELVRLSRIDPHYRHGAEEVTESIIAILEMLERDALVCGKSAEMARFAQLKSMYTTMRSELDRYYLGQPF